MAMAMAFPVLATPDALKVPVTVTLPPTTRVPPTPTPPDTTKAPVVVEVEVAVLDNVKVFWKVGAPVPLLTNTVPDVPAVTNPVVPVLI
jgi:hypothetical protein